MDMWEWACLDEHMWKLMMQHLSQPLLHLFVLNDFLSLKILFKVSYMCTVYLGHIHSTLPLFSTSQSHPNFMLHVFKIIINPSRAVLSIYACVCGPPLGHRQPTFTHKVTLPLSEAISSSAWGGALGTPLPSMLKVWSLFLLPSPYSLK